MKNRKKRYLIVLATVMLMITLGYAILSNNLTINGNSKLASSTWDIHFDNVVPKEGRVTIGEGDSEAVINPNDNTEVTYNVTLSKPGDFYEFNVDIVNAGSIDGQVERINSSLKIGDDDAFVINSDSSNLPPYLNYLITYSDDSEIMPNHLLKSGKSETIKVRIEFKRDIDSSILPEDDIDITLTIQPDLIQENEDGYNKGEEPYTPFTYDLDLDSIQNATIKYDAINQEKCVEYYSQDAPDEINLEAYCRGEDIEYNGDTINFIDALNNASRDYLQQLSDNGVITLKYVGIKSIDINKDTCIEFLNNQGWDGVESLCNGGPDPWGDDFYDYIAWDGDDWYIENGVFNNVEYGEIIPDVIITGYKEQVPTNLEIPRDINGRKVVAIADDSFDNKGIISVTIPNSVEYIGSNAFDNNNLDEVNVSGTDVMIGNCAFGNKENITSHNLPNDYICVDGCVTGSNELYDGYEYSKGQYNYYYIEDDDGWGVYLANKSSTKPVTSKLCSMVDGKSITSMSYMFDDSNTTSIDFSSFDTSNVKNMSGMFSYMNNIKDLDLSTFNTSNVEDMSGMFYNSNNLETIYTSDSFMTDAVVDSDYMFYYNDKLVGGKGTAYSNEHIDKEYAHIDEGDTNPGYFTKKGTLTVTLNPNGGDVSRNKIYYNDNEEIGYLPIPVREGKVFTGWYRDLECTIKVESDYIVDSNMELIAGWRDYENVQITFDKNNEDATGTMDNQTILEYTPGYLKLNEYTLDNYAFVGWNTKRDGTGISYLDGAEITVTGNTTLYAQWIKVYIVSFDRNSEDALGSMASQSFLYGISSNLNTNAYILENYEFIGWNTERDGTGVSYSDGEEITISGNITLYAQWIRIYTLTFDKNNNEAVGNTYTMTLLSGIPTQIEDEAFSAYTLTGMIIDNYNTEANGEGICYYQLQSITITQDIVLYAQWEKKGLLYSVLKNEAKNGGLAREYTGSHGDSMDTTKSTKKIYNWYASNDTEGTQVLDKNNVIFAGQCWQMIRTTDTGGVKMIYNGEAENGKCLNTRGNHIGYYGVGFSLKNLASNYWYGTDYAYDKTNNVFSIVGSTEQTVWNDTTGPELVGKYTCRGTSEADTCSTLYFVESYYDISNAYVVPINNSSHYSQFGELSFNRGSSLADVGYMHNIKYTPNANKMTSTETMLSSYSLNTTYWYADSLIWGSPNANAYILDDPYQITSADDYPSLVGKYTLRYSSQTASSSHAYYIAAVNGSNMYYIYLSDSINHTLSDYNYRYTYGDGYIDNGNGTYTINNPTTIYRSDWYTIYSDVGAGKYVCKNATNDTCGDLWYTTSTSNTSMTYIKVADNYKYAKSFEYKLDPDDNTYKYFLDDATSITFWNINDSTNKTRLNNAHYTCWNENGKCTNISYIYNFSGITPSFINLTEGKSVEDAKNEMLYNSDVNQINSTIKNGIDAWYKKYILPYDKKIEDTIFCNDRSQKNADTNGWNPNGGMLDEQFSFTGYDTTDDYIENDLSCTNITDKFSVSNNLAKLTYKVGLISYAEMSNLKNIKTRYTGQDYWLASPVSHYYYFTYGSYVDHFMGYFGGYDVSFSHGVRPALSLKPGTEYSTGDGSMANPYIVQ